MTDREMTGALTMRRKLIMCYEIMIARSGHGHLANEKQLPVFQRGYNAGWKDRGFHEQEGKPRWPTLCPACRGYLLESQWCELCNGTGFAAEIGRRMKERK